MEVVKIRMQTSATGHKTTIDVVKELGLRGLFKNSVSTLQRDVPFNTIFFTLNAKGREVVLRGTNKKNPNSVEAFGIGAGSAM